MKNIKLFLVIILAIIAVGSAIGIGICLWMAYQLYRIGEVWSAGALCLISAGFAVWQIWSVVQNRSDIVRDLKEAWAIMAEKK